MPEDHNEELGINIGYPMGQLWKILSSTGEKAQERVQKWQQVISGLVDGSLHVGSRTPIAGTPSWVTLEVMTGGFLTGNLLAGGTLLPFEVEKLKAILNAEGAPSGKHPHLNVGTVRKALNAYFLSDQGRNDLATVLATGCFRIQVPEEGALLIATWLIENNEVDRAQELIEALMPHFDQLRFYPGPATEPIPTTSGVFLLTAGEAIERLRAKRPNKRVQQMNEAIQVWQPLYDETVRLFLETVEGQAPEFQRTEHGELARAGSGQPIVIGGWPCQHYPADWTTRANNLLSDYKLARAQYSQSNKPDNPKENFSRLRTYLTTVCRDPKALNTRDIGMIRKILASYISKHGNPTSERLNKTRAVLQSMAKRPLHSLLSGVMADRLQCNPQDSGVSDLRQRLGPLSAAEATALQCDPGEPLPRSVLAKAMTCLEAPLRQLIEQGLIGSNEVMARVLPLLTARIGTLSINDRALARLVEQLYRAFRRRRSLLLLNLQSQARFDELPWIIAIEPWVSPNLAISDAARQALLEASTLTIETFPQTILSNKLVKELRTLCKTADLHIPLVEELAADIFQGKFSENFLHAAHEAATLLRGTIYEKYYRIDFEAVANLDDLRKQPLGPATSPGFARMCHTLANAETNWRSSTATNGTILEQSQILTTHNLASLFNAFDLKTTMRPQLQNLARKCFKWVCRRLQHKLSDWRLELHAIKNSAYAWRQMIFYLSLLDSQEVIAFIEWASEHLSKQNIDFQKRFDPALQGLIAVVQDSRFDNVGFVELNTDGSRPQAEHRQVSVAALAGRQFLGWTTGRHWLRTPESVFEK